MYKFLCDYTLSFFFAIYLGLEMQGNVVTLFKLFSNCWGVFLKKLHYFTFPLAV